MRAPYEAICVAYGRRTVFGADETSVDTGADGWIVSCGPFGPQPISPVLGDLLDIAAVVHRCERQLTRHSAGNAYVRYELVIPVSDPDLWRGKPGEILEELLGFLGMATWNLRFVQRRSRNRRYSAPSLVQHGVTRIALFSGGLDSLCGAGAGFVSSSDTQFCSFYTRQQKLQAQLASELRFPPPTQWRLQGGAGRGRSFYYRSFLFLALAAATAETFGAHEIVQCENGILSSAIPPVPSLAVTRHAHPRLHSLFAQLLNSLLDRSWRVTNPLRGITKRQALVAMRNKLGPRKSAALAEMTQSCWNLSAPHAFGVRNFGRWTKRANQQCGVCVPCIVRRTAIPFERFAFDLKQDAVRNHPKLGAHFLEYVEFVSAINAASTPADLRPSLPAEALELIDDGWTDLESLHSLLREFAAEFVETFELRL